MEIRMSADQSVALVRRYFEECVSAASGPEQDRALALLDELLTDDFVMLYNGETDPERGREAHKAFLARHVRVYPDDDWTIEALVADDDVAACLWRIRARHEPTGNRIDVSAADFFRVRDGRLAELRRFLDFKTLDRQTQPRAAEG